MVLAIYNNVNTWSSHNPYDLWYGGLKYTRSSTVYKEEDYWIYSQDIDSSEYWMALWADATNPSGRYFTEITIRKQSSFETRFNQNNAVTFTLNAQLDPSIVGVSRGPWINGQRIWRRDPWNSASYQAWNVNFWKVNILSKDAKKEYILSRSGTTTTAARTEEEYTRSLALFWHNYQNSSQTYTGNNITADFVPTYLAGPYTYFKGDIGSDNRSNPTVRNLGTVNGGTVKEYTSAVNWAVKRHWTEQPGHSRGDAWSSTYHIPNIINNNNHSINASSGEIVFDFGRTYFYDGAVRATSFTMAKQYMRPSTYVIQEYDPGQPAIADTSEYTYENSREKIYKRSTEDVDGFPKGKSDPAYGVGWAKDRHFSGSDHGYYISQIFIENGLIYESNEKTKIGTTSGSSYISSLNNSPQLLIINNINKSSDVPNGIGVESDYYRLYRTDSLATERSIGIIRFLNDTSKKPTLSDPERITDPHNSAFKANTMVISNLNLTYDSDPRCCYIDLDCFAGTLVDSIVFYNSSDQVISTTTFPDGNLSKSKGLILNTGLPNGTQKIWIRVINDHDECDAFSKSMRGFNYIYLSKIFPLIGGCKLTRKSICNGCCN